MTTAPFDPRSAWTNRGPARPLSPWTPGNPVGVAYHYIGGQGVFNPDHAGCLAWVNATEIGEETGTLGTHDVYSALSYNLCVCAHGHVIEGRGIQYQSGAQLHGNANYVAILVMVNVGQPMTDGHKTAGAAARDIVRWAYPQAQQTLGHRDVADNPTGTACPGDIVEAWVRAGAPPGTPTPPPPPKVRPDMHLVITQPIVSKLRLGSNYWMLTEDGGIVTLEGTFYGTPYGKAYFAGRKGAQLRANPNLIKRVKHPYVVIADTGEVYGRDGF